MPSALKRLIAGVITLAVLLAGQVADPAALSAAPLRGTRLSAGFIEHSLAASVQESYTWSLTATPSVSSLTLGAGASGNVLERVQAVRTQGARMVSVTGTLCVSNVGTEATDNLVVRVDLRYPSDATARQVVTLVDATRPASVQGRTRQCFPFSGQVASLGQAQPVKATAIVTITNTIGSMSFPFGPNGPSAVAQWKASSAAPNEALTITGPLGATNAISWTFVQSGERTYVHPLQCPQAAGSHTDTFSVQGTTQVASASFQVTCTGTPSPTPTPTPTPTPRPTATPAPPANTYSATFIAVTANQTVATGGSACYQLTLRNTGTLTDTYALTQTNSNSTYTSRLYVTADCSTTSAPSAVSLVAGAVQTLYLKVQKPAGIAASNITGVKAASFNDGTVAPVVQVTTR